MPKKIKTVRLRVDGTYSDTIIADSVQIIDGKLYLDDREITITDRLCLEVL